MMDDQKYMCRCLQLARLGQEWVAPNPMVGAVLVCDGRIIGEGFHRFYGDKHAEPNAFASVVDAELLSRSTLYVNLEPCSHYGKTPPCAELIVAKRLRRVVVGSLDPNPLVAGRGVRMMREAGIEVEVGVMEDECDELNKRFFTFHRLHRPYITVKWAQTADGFIDSLRSGKQENVTVISNRVTKQLVHQLRSRNMAIMVGTRTALLDNPRLRTTRWMGYDPLRVVTDRTLKLGEDYHLLTDGGRTLVLTEGDAYGFSTTAELVEIDFAHDMWGQVCRILYEHGVHSLIVEGGTTLIESLFDEGVCDEVQIEISETELGKGVVAPKMPCGVQDVRIVECNRLIHIKM